MKKRKKQPRNPLGEPTMRIKTDAFGQPILPPGASGSAADIARIAEETRAHGRALLSTHPAIGWGTPAAVAPGMQTVSSDVDDPTAEAIPVMLFELQHALTSIDKSTGGARELQVEGICQAGFHRYTPGFSLMKLVPGWSLRRAGSLLELRDGHGDGLWADAVVSPEPEWVSAATSQRHVMVLYGIHLGVRKPGDVGERAYTDVARREELTKARDRGLVAAGIVAWRG